MTRKLVLSMVLSVDGYANALGGEFVELKSSFTIAFSRVECIP